ncbi:MAG: thiamine-monophosphate kinase, partial [Bacteroidetes bacterium]|nr:thiamine-monophosphate kinase [Bacteroidota bacterium]
SASFNGLTISITALGMATPGSVVYRNGAKKNDLVCASGHLGGAYMGLLLLQREKKLFEQDPSQQPQLDDYQHLLERQLKPEARRDIITQLREIEVKPTSMIDISDGLSSDLLHICDASKLGCKLFANKIPVHPATDKLSTEMGMSPLVAALNGGEDYELLFTIAMEDFEKVQNMQQVTVIGHMTDNSEGTHMILDDDSAIPLVAQGWQAQEGL